MKEYVAVLGGTGFSGESPRLKAGVSLAKLARVPLVTSGMGFQNGEYEHEFIARYVKEQGIPEERIIVGKYGDPFNRNTQDDILQVLNALPWSSFTEPPRIVFLTEGPLHAFRVKRYALLQLPQGHEAEIICQDNGGPLTWERRRREVISVLKFFLWRIQRRKQAT